jgi:protein-S-isoprenylcysteine O-methyltransferase Ste14
LAPGAVERFDIILKEADMNPVLRRIFQLLFMVILQAALLFLGAWTFGWSTAWWYIGLYVGMLFLASFVMLPTRKEVIAERGRGAEGAKPWDKWITRLLAIPSLGLLVLSGLDHRFGWTGVLPLWTFVLGAALFALGYFIVLWAMYANPFFSQVVRIQAERGHTAVTEGPYRFVRHPGYAGMFVSMIGSVLLLGSLYGWFCFLFYLILLLIRTSLEDRALQAELPGYLEYAKKVRYRLLPGVW